MSKRTWNFKITDEEALLEYCPDALIKIEPVVKYRKNYQVIAKLLDAAKLTGQTVPGVEIVPVEPETEQEHTNKRHK